jgi:hypothetical protein
MPRVPGQEPPHGEGGGAAERLRQFEQARGLRPNDSDEEEAEESPADPEDGEQESADDEERKGGR